MRKDLGMRKGKMIAQGAHASLGVFTQKMYFLEGPFNHALQLDKAMDEWLESSYTKIVVGCDSAKELLDLEREAKENSIPCKLIVDSGLTEFNGVPTITCIAIGPGYNEDIDKLTGHLNLL